MMKKLIAVVLASAPFALAQQSAITSAPCSPIAPDNTGVITIKCTGLTPDQAKALAGVPAFLNKILQNQKFEADEIISRLDKCVEGVKEAEKQIYSGYDFNGAKRVQRPGYIGVTSGPETTVFQQMLNLQDNHQWEQLLRVSDDEIKTTPGWLTPYLFSGVANANLGNTTAAIQRLTFVRDEAAGNPDYADADRLLHLLQK
ncbi:MAG: hypothetical protein WB524_20190 [Acidobacteriaceae bacterium]